MSTQTTTSSRRRNTVSPALRVPLTVLASLPERMRVFAETLKVAAAASDAGFREPHNAMRRAFDDANGTSNQAFNAFAELQHLVTTKSAKNAMDAALNAKALTTAIYKSSGNIHNDGQFKSTFHDVATLEATVAALQSCGDDIRAAVRPFGY